MAEVRCGHRQLGSSLLGPGLRLCECEGKSDKVLCEIAEEDTE
jgi:hypothetical protein